MFRSIDKGCYVQKSGWMIKSKNYIRLIILLCLIILVIAVGLLTDNLSIRHTQDDRIGEAEVCREIHDIPFWASQAGCYVEKKNVSNRICVLDYDNIDRGIIDEIHSPARGGIYSIGYDEREDRFYSTNFLGTKEGDANVIFSYNGIFKSVKEEFTIDDLMMRNSPSYQTMGVQCIVDNTAYVLYSEPKFVVAGYDLNSGRLKFVYQIPNLTEDGKEVIRPESLFYNSDKKEVMIQTATAVVYCDSSALRR